MFNRKGMRVSIQLYHKSNAAIATSDHHATCIYAECGAALREDVVIVKATNSKSCGERSQALNGEAAKLIF
jgi:hypothetical protein